MVTRVDDTSTGTHAPRETIRRIAASLRPWPSKAERAATVEAARQERVRSLDALRAASDEMERLRELVLDLGEAAGGLTAEVVALIRAASLESALALPVAEWELADGGAR